VLESGGVGALGASRGPSRGRGVRGGGRGKSHQGGWQQSKEQTNSPAQLTRQESGFCWVHFKYGDKAFFCKGNCSLQGNYIKRLGGVNTVRQRPLVFLRDQNTGVKLFG